MFIRPDVLGSTHDHHHHNLGKDHSTTATTVTKVNRDSHLIKKSSPSSPPLTTLKSKTHPRQPQPPLIIYAHAPRVIHTKPQEFKALVQTLTGYTGNKKSTATTKNDLTSPPPPQPPTPLLPPHPTCKQPLYFDFEEFETKNVVPLINNNIFSIIQDDHKQNTSTMDENMNNINSLGGDCGYNFAAPIFDPPLMHQGNSTSLPFFTPTYGDQLCCINNNFKSAYNNNNSNNNNSNSSNSSNDQMIYDETGSRNGSGCYYSDGLSSSFDLSSTLSSVEEAIDELTEFC